MPTEQKKQGTVSADGESMLVNPLLLKKPRPIRNWCEWLELWEEAKTFQEMLGLLHVGFDVSLVQAVYNEEKFDQIDRIRFYLAVADGYADSCRFRSEEDRGSISTIGYDANGFGIKKSPSEVCQLVARKAFDVLCQNFFKMELRGGGKGGDLFGAGWENIVASERLFPLITSFFRLEGYRSGLVRNLPRWSLKRHEEIVLGFLLNLARFLWGREKQEADRCYYYGDGPIAEERRPCSAEIQARINEAKPWMIEVLNFLGNLEILEEWMLELDEACLDTVQKIAMRSELSRGSFPVKDDRLVGSLDEACLVGSKAAWFLKRRELKLKELQRLEEIREAEKVIGDAKWTIDSRSHSAKSVGTKD